MSKQDLSKLYTAEQFNSASKELTIVSGHRTCHPETCSCWDYRVTETATGKFVTDTDSREHVAYYINQYSEEAKK